jgi:hypothetical protein
VTKRLLALAIACTMPHPAPASSPVAPALRCTLEAPVHAVAGGPVMLRFTVTNTGPGPLQLLRWNTPFEAGWFAPFVSVTRDGQALAWQGPVLKRGDPAAEDYLRLEAGAARTAELDLALPVDLSSPGRYRVVPRIHLVDAFDARAAAPPRPRAAHAGTDLRCPAVEFILARR